MDASASFIGGSYVSQSVLADCEELINWYKENIQAPAASAKTALYPTPGVEILSQVAYGTGRAHFYLQGREFAVIGPSFVEIYRNGTSTTRGTVAIDANPATINSSGDLGDELFITSGGNGYLFNLGTNAFSTISALAGKATMGAYLDGYFLALDKNSSTLYSSDLGVGGTWQTGVYLAQRSAMPDRWVSMRVAGKFIYLLGERTSEIWYNAGSFPFPFFPYSAPIIQFGCIAPFSPGVIGDNLIWAALSPSGRRCIVQANIQAKPVSTYPIDTAMESYADIEMAVGDVYSDRGHTFYLLGFDGANVTWAFDADTGEWHKRMTWDREKGEWNAWRPRFYANSFGEHRILDKSGRTVFRMGADYAFDANEEPIRRLRRTPALTSGNDRIFYSSLELFFETGLGMRTNLYACFTWEKLEQFAVDASCSRGTIQDYTWYVNGVLAGTGEVTQLFPYPGNGDVVSLVISGGGGSSTCTVVVPLNENTGSSDPPLDVDGGGEPQIQLRMSNDAGRTWPIPVQMRSAGKIGEYSRRARWMNLGSARRRVFEVVCVDPVPWRLVGADLRIAQDVPAGEKDRG